MSETISRQYRWQLGRIADGRCVKCGRPRGKRGTKNHCRKCADIHNQYVATRHKIRRAAGLCWWCNAKALVRNGKTMSLCSNCLAKGRSYQRAYRKRNAL